MKQPDQYVKIVHSNNNLYLLVARRSHAHEIDARATYHLNRNRVARCIEAYGTDHGIHAIKKAAQGLMRWRGAATVDPVDKSPGPLINAL